MEKRRTTQQIRDEAAKTTADLLSGKTSPEEAYRISNIAQKELNSYNADLSAIERKIRGQENKPKSRQTSDYIIDYDSIIEIEQNLNKSIDNNVIVEFNLTEEHKSIAANIKLKLRKTAQTIIEIGEEISNVVKGQSKEYKEMFYEEIGMSRRSALRYQQIANNLKIQELKDKDELEGKTMQDLIHLISIPTKTTSTTDARKVAQGFFSKYGKEPDTLKEIMKELQLLLDNQDTNKE